MKRDKASLASKERILEVQSTELDDKKEKLELDLNLLQSETFKLQKLKLGTLSFASVIYFCIHV